MTQFLFLFFEFFELKVFAFFKHGKVRPTCVNLVQTPLKMSFSCWADNKLFNLGFP